VGDLLKEHNVIRNLCSTAQQCGARESDATSLLLQGGRGKVTHDCLVRLHTVCRNLRVNTGTGAAYETSTVHHKLTAKRATEGCASMYLKISFRKAASPEHHNTNRRQHWVSRATSHEAAEPTSCASLSWFTVQQI
jgi:hypothetical protein